MKLSDIKGEDALDVLADIIEPVALILADGKVQELYESGKPKLLLVKHIIKNNKKQVLEIMAILERKSYDEYVKEVNLLSLPMKLLELLQDEDLIAVFQSQVETTAKTSSMPATENTEVEKK